MSTREMLQTLLTEIYSRTYAATLAHRPDLEPREEAKNAMITFSATMGEIFPDQGWVQINRSMSEEEEDRG